MRWRPLNKRRDSCSILGPSYPSPPLVQMSFFIEFSLREKERGRDDLSLCSSRSLTWCFTCDMTYFFFSLLDEVWTADPQQHST